MLCHFAKLEKKQKTSYKYYLCLNLINMFVYLWTYIGSPCGLAGKESAYSVGDLGLIPGLGRSPGAGKATHPGILA